MKAALLFALGATAEARKEFPINMTQTSGPLSCAGSFEMTVSTPHENPSFTGNFSFTADHQQDSEGQCSGHAMGEMNVNGPAGPGSDDMVNANFKMFGGMKDSWLTGYTFVKLAMADGGPSPPGPPPCKTDNGPVPFCSVPPQMPIDQMLPKYFRTRECRGASGNCDIFVFSADSHGDRANAQFEFQEDSDVLVRMEMSKTGGPERIEMTVDFTKFDMDSAIPESEWSVPLGDLLCPPDPHFHGFGPGGPGGPYGPGPEPEPEPEHESYSDHYHSYHHYFDAEDAPMLAAEATPLLGGLHAARASPARLYELLRAGVLAAQAEHTSRAAPPAAVEDLVEEHEDADEPSRLHDRALAAGVLVLPMGVVAAMVAAVCRRRRTDANEYLLAEDEA